MENGFTTGDGFLQISQFCPNKKKSSAEKCGVIDAFTPKNTYEMHIYSRVCSSTP